MSWGPNLLIKQGAKLVQEWNDVVVELKARTASGSRSSVVTDCKHRGTRYLNRRTLNRHLYISEPWAASPERFFKL
jgi:predicted Rossmann fold nucleotide-binding protein DprA/Smf involved in DNA uptake